MLWKIFISDYSLKTNFSLELVWRINLPHYYNIIILTNPSARAGYDTRSIFKRSLTGLNSEFSFSQTSCLTIIIITYTELHLIFESIFLKSLDIKFLKLMQKQIILNTRSGFKHIGARDHKNFNKLFKSILQKIFMLLKMLFKNFYFIFQI